MPVPSDRKGVPVPPHLLDEWPAWRCVRGGFMTMAEASSENFFDLKDLDDGCDVLDLIDRAEALAAKELK